MSIRTSRIMEMALEGLTPTWSNIKPPSRPGLDPTDIRGYTKFALVCGTLLIPHNAKITHMKTPDGTPFMQAKANDVEVNVYGMNLEPGDVLTGRISVMIKTWEPRSENDVTRNYSIYLKVEHADKGVAPSGDVKICDEVPQRDRIDGGHFEHVSSDRRRKQSILVVMGRKPRRQPEVRADA